MDKELIQRVCGIEDHMNPVMLRALQQMTGSQRLQIAMQMTELVRKTIIRNVLIDHPDWPEWRIVREAARQFSWGATDVVPEERYYHCRLPPLDD